MKIIDPKGYEVFRRNYLFKMGETIQPIQLISKLPFGEYLFYQRENYKTLANR